MDCSFPISQQDEYELVSKKIDQKPIDMVEQKFHKGDWITNDRYIKMIVGIGTKSYKPSYYIFKDGTTKPIYDIDKKWHLWTIEDAKDGDILVASDGSIFIFKEVCGTSCKHYVAFAKDDTIQVNYNLDHFWESSRGVHPATKEQCDLLFQKMKETGYTFDFEKKELKKIEDEIEIPFGAKDSELQEETYFIPKGFHAEIEADKVVIKKGEKSAAWSDEDESCINNAIAACRSLYGEYSETAHWLKSLKDRVQRKEE